MRLGWKQGGITLRVAVQMPLVWVTVDQLVTLWRTLRYDSASTAR